jgi:alpha-1,3-mannosyltransferase
MQVPPYALILVTLSKRLHSIYVLRLFNDGMAMLFFYAAVLAWTNKRPFITAGSILFRFVPYPPPHRLI